MTVKVKIKKGDTVEVIAGADKSKRGEVIRVLSDNGRVVVQGVSLRKKHQRQGQTVGGRTMSPGIIEFEASIDISNVMLVCPSCHEASRVGIRREPGKVIRVCKSCSALMDEE
jgi:large subunit ribosomal protein L24